MKFKMLKATVAGLILSVSGFANAGLITETQEQTVDFQDFTFNFNVNDWALGAVSSLLLEVQGDFSPNFPTEYFTLLVEGNNYGNWSRDNSATTSIFSSDTATLINSFSFNTADTSSFLSNNVFSFNVNFSDEVHKGWGNIGYGAAAAPYVKATFRYNSVAVPEPSTLAIFALGMIGLASRRFNKQS